jgi:prophage tail gpP-like protein
VPDISLLVNGRAYGGWKTARVIRGIESICGAVELNVSERWDADSNPWPIYEEDECSLRLGSEVVLTGYVDKLSLSYGAGEHSLSVSGRDKAALLVDCSRYEAPWEFNGVPVLTVAKRVCSPFGVAVTVAPGLTIPTPPEKIAVSPGDSPHDVLERLCRLSGVLAISDGQGGVQLMRPGTTRAVTDLIEGENILAASADFDASSRFYRYVVLGQHAGTDAWSGGGTAGVIGSALDANVRRTERVLVVRPEGNVTPAHAKRRAEWEATVRAARADAVTVTVQGWTTGNGALWPVNALVRVQSPHLRVDGDMLISQVVYSVGEDGTKTTLTLRAPKAFLPEPGTGGSAVGPDQTWKEIRRGV